MKPEIIVALDGFNSIEDLITFIRITEDTDIIYKVGKESHIKYGDRLLNELSDNKVFLDLKLHDIPKTVANSIDAIIDRDIWMTNIHCSGGPAMMEAAANAIEKRNSDMILIGVTILTSLTEKDLIDMVFGNRDIGLLAKSLAKNAKDSGLHGVVCSPLEVKKVKGNFGDDFLCVTPGVRWNAEDMNKPYEKNSDDQRRTMTPTEAKKVGSDYLVIGRPITENPDPVKVIELLKNNLQK